MADAPGTSENFVEALIIGAGPAGLAVGGCLQHDHIPFLILDSAAEIAIRWRQHYDRLHLHTAKRFSALPYQPFPADYPTYPSKAQFVAYLEAYARPFQAQLRLNQTVNAITRCDDQWEVRTNDTVYRARFVIVATGYNQTAICPEWPDQAQFAGKILHSSAYKNGEPFRGQTVLVVGIGNSGAEIAMDLAEHGAVPHMAVRSPVNITFRELFGIPYQYLSIPFSRLPAWLVDAFVTPINALKFGDFKTYGLRKLPYGSMTQVKKYHQIPIIDIGIMRLIRARQVMIRPGIERFTTDGVMFSDGSTTHFDAVVLATGYRPQLDPLLSTDYTLLDPKGYPLTSGQPTPAPDLCFCGFRNSPAGLLYTIAGEARQIARHISTSKQH